MPEHAVAAYCKLDGSVFHGRMLHLLPGKAKEENEGIINCKNYIIKLISTLVVN